MPWLLAAPNPRFRGLGMKVSAGNRFGSSSRAHTLRGRVVDHDDLVRRSRLVANRADRGRRHLAGVPVHEHDRHIERIRVHGRRVRIIRDRVARNRTRFPVSPAHSLVERSLDFFAEVTKKRCLSKHQETTIVGQADQSHACPDASFCATIGA